MNKFIEHQFHLSLRACKYRRFVKFSIRLCHCPHCDHKLGSWAIQPRELP